MQAEKLQEQRQKIDSIDQQLVTLLEKRMQVVSEIARIKNDSHVVYDEKREKFVLEQVGKQVENDSYRQTIQATFEDIMKHSRNFQNQQLKS